jgi:hypothetical protein
MGGRVVNVMMRVPYDRELEIRNELAALTGQYANERLAIAYRIADFPDDGPLPGAFLAQTVAVENHTLSDFSLSGLMGGQLIPNMRRARTLYAARALLYAGEVDAVMAPRAQLEHALPEGFAVHAPPLPGVAHAEWCIGIAVRFSYKMLGYAVDDVIRAAVGEAGSQRSTRPTASPTRRRRGEAGARPRPRRPPRAVRARRRRRATTPSAASCGTTAGPNCSGRRRRRSSTRR